MALKRGRKPKTEVAMRISDEAKETLNSRKYNIKPQYVKKKKYKKRPAFYNEDFDFLEHFQIVRAFYKRKFGIPLRELELLFTLYPMNYFTHSDYFEIPKAFTYLRIIKLVQLGHVVVFAKGKNKSKDVYTLTTSARTLVRDFYRYLSGEKKIPEEARHNPMAKKKDVPAIDKLRMDLIKKINQLEPSKSKKAMYE